MKVFVNKANENWVVDRLVDEWYNGNSDISTTSIEEADVVWLLSPWIWNQIPLNILKSKKVLTTIHHVDPNKFNENEFRERDMYVDCYHVPNNFTKDFIKNYTDKKIEVISYWANSKLWYPLDKEECRKELELPLDKFLIGSFQRDTEGFDLKSPKMCKGPDVFCDMVTNIHQLDPNVEVVLAGWRRQYVMNRLDEDKVNHYYFELPSFETINKLYNCLDLYIVGSRWEGGPQSIIECALNKTPIISTDVGIASNILPQVSIFGKSEKEVVQPDRKTAYKNVQKYLMEDLFKEYKKLFKEI